jgi:hypothetical protein
MSLLIEALLTPSNLSIRKYPALTRPDLAIQVFSRYFVIYDVPCSIDILIRLLAARDPKLQPEKEDRPSEFDFSSHNSWR